MTLRVSQTLIGAAAMVALFSSTSLAQDAHDTAVAEAKRIGTGVEAGSYVEVIDQNSGPEGETLQQVYKAFSEGTGIEVRSRGPLMPQRSFSRASAPGIRQMSRESSLGMRWNMPSRAYSRISAPRSATN